MQAATSVDMCDASLCGQCTCAACELGAKLQFMLTMRTICKTSSEHMSCDSLTEPSQICFCCCPCSLPNHVHSGWAVRGLLACYDAYGAALSHRLYTNMHADGPAACHDICGAACAHPEP